MTSPAAPAPLPFLARVDPPIDGALRARPEDFRVVEVPAYEPSGEGDHLYVRFEKVDLTTPEAVRRIARALDVDPRQAGWAGLKDRDAVTEQRASFLFGDADRLAAPIEGVRILEAARHRNKLRTGHLRGNRFELLVRGAPHDRLEDARAALAVLVARGAPAYFGPQRFGRGGANVRDARAWILEGGRAPRKPFARKMLVSALQSAVFNELLAERVAEGTMDAALEGDLLEKVESGGLFECEDPSVDGPRVAAFEVSPTAPMPGIDTRWATGVVGAREAAARERWGLDDDTLRRFKKAGAGTRRPLRSPISDASVELDPDGLRVAFTLPSGGYATVVMRELLGRDVG